MIPHHHHHAKSLQATNSCFIFDHPMHLAHQLDSNCHTMQTVRNLVTLCLEQRNSMYIQVGIFQTMTCDLCILICHTCNSATQKPSSTIRNLLFSLSEVFTILFLRNQKNGQLKTLLYLLFSRLNLIPLIISCMYNIVFFVSSWL